MNTIKINNKNGVLMVAHRGVSGLERENTAAAFIAAGNRSYFGIETDLRKTIDGKYVCLHDDNLMRVGGENLRPADVTLQTLRGARLNNYNEDKTFAHLVVPTLEEYVSICKRYDKTCVLELKLSFTNEELAEIVGVIDGIGHLESTIFIAFDIENLIKLKAYRSDLVCQFLTSSDYEELVPTLVRHSLDLDINHNALSAELVEKCHANGITVNCWTVNTETRAQEVIAMGVDQITTNILE